MNTKKALLVAAALIPICLLGWLIYDHMQTGDRVSEVLGDDFLPGDYVAYNPPIDAHGPGWTFEYVRSGDNAVQSTVCSSLYSTDLTITTKSDVSLPSGTSNRTLEFGMAVSILDQFIKGLNPEIRSNLSVAEKSTISWSGLSSWEIPADFRYNEDGTVIQVSNRCRSALKDRADDEGKLQGIYVVFEALRASKTILSVDWSLETNSDSESDDANSTGISASVTAKNLFEFEAGVDPDLVGSRTLEFQQPRFIGYKAMTLDKFLPTGAFGGARVEVTGSILTKTETLNAQREARSLDSQ